MREYMPINSMIYNLASSYKGTPYFLESPLIVDNPEVKEQIISSRFFSTILEIWDELKTVREAAKPALVKLYLTPPGPPVRAQILARIHGPNYAELRAIANVGVMWGPELSPNGAVNNFPASARWMRLMTSAP